MKQNEEYKTIRIRKELHANLKIYSAKKGVSLVKTIERACKELLEKEKGK